MSDAPAWFRGSDGDLDRHYPEPPQIPAVPEGEQVAEVENLAEDLAGDVAGAVVIGDGAQAAEIADLAEAHNSESVVASSEAAQHVPAAVPEVSDTAPSPARSISTRVIVTVVVVALVIAYLLFELIGRSVVSGMVSRQIRAGSQFEDVSVSVGSGWWKPTTTGLVLLGRLDRVSVDLGSGDIAGLPVTEAAYVFEGLEVSHSIIRRSVQVTSLRSGQVDLVVDVVGIFTTLGVNAQISSGELFIEGSDEPAMITTENGMLVITTTGPMAGLGRPTVQLPVSDPYLMPCEPSARITGKHLHLSCTGTDMPGVLGRSLGADSSTGTTNGEESDAGGDVDISLTPPVSVTQSDPSGASTSSGSTLEPSTPPSPDRPASGGS